jgi:mRNA interferase HigB
VIRCPRSASAPRSFWRGWTQADGKAEVPLLTWYTAVSKAEWCGPADIRAMYNTADFVGDNCVIFNIGGNKFRLIVHVSYEYRAVLIKFVGTHADYDRIDPETV